MKIYLVSNSADISQYLRTYLRDRHGLNTTVRQIFLPLPESEGDHKNIMGSLLDAVALAERQGQPGDMVILVRYTGKRYLYAANLLPDRPADYRTLGTKADIQKAVSADILLMRRDPFRKLSIREEWKDLEGYRTDSINVLKDPVPWISGNSFLQRLPKDGFARLLNFLANERGLFLKAGLYIFERNYWYSTLNGGLPVVRKKDEVHEGTFMLHDLFHFIFLDPILAFPVEENYRDLYVLNRMLSESFTMVLADMISVDQSKLIETGYDTGKRKIYPVFQSSGLSSSSADDLCTLLKANVQFCTTGRPDAYRNLGISNDALEPFVSKYSVFFSGDYTWNSYNYDRMAEEALAKPDEFKEYYDYLRNDLGIFSLADLANKSVVDGRIDINRMFDWFYDQLRSGLDYASSYDKMAHGKKALKKYLGGQLLITYRFSEFKGALELRKLLKRVLERIDSCDEISVLEELQEKATTAIGALVDDLADAELIEPHERALYKVHIPHFQAMFVNYEGDAEEFSNLAEKAASFTTRARPIVADMAVS